VKTYSNGVINDMSDRILEGNKTNISRAYAFLNLIPKRGKLAFSAFYDAVLGADIYEAADILHPENAPHEPKSTLNSKGGPKAQESQRGFQDSEDEEPPEVRPHAATSPSFTHPSHKPQVVKVIDYDFEGARKSYYLEKYKKSLSSDNFYKMKNKKRGKVFLINNEYFDHLDARSGTHHDKQSLDKLFDKMGFLVVKNSVSNKTLEMREFLEEKAKEDF